MLADCSFGRSVPTSFVPEQIGDLTTLDRSLVAQNTPVNNVDCGYNCVYGSLATPGNYTYANPWATGRAVNHTFAPFVDSNPSRLTESTFAAGAAHDDGIGLPAAPNPYILGPSAAQGPVGEYIGAGYQCPDPSLSTVNSLAAGAIGNGYQDHFPASNHAADGNGNGYQNSFPAENFNTRRNAAVNFPTGVARCRPRSQSFRYGSKGSNTPHLCRLLSPFQPQDRSQSPCQDPPGEFQDLSVPNCWLRV